MYCNTKRKDLPLVEIGWMIVGKLKALDLRAIELARNALLKRLGDTFPMFSWQMPLVRWDELVIAPREEPALLLEHGVAERNARHWDFSMVFTGVELIGHYRSQAMATISRSLDCAAVSTSQLCPRYLQPDASDEQRMATMADLLQRLVLYCIGRLCGLEQESSDNANPLFSPSTRLGGNAPGDFSADQYIQLSEALGEIADRRLEETSSYGKVNSIRFAVMSSWVNRRDIATALLEAKPWQFPFRLSKLTTAALSAMLVLMITAEVWELAASQDHEFVVLLSLIAVGLATIYVILRQRLYVPRLRVQMTEQTVTTNMTTVLIVLLGMTTTYLLVFAIAVLLGSLLFHPGVVLSWAGSAAHSPFMDEYLLLAGFVAALAIFIGALGTSFENSYYFRHITFVDEEVG